MESSAAHKGFLTKAGHFKSLLKELLCASQSRIKKRTVVLEEEGVLGGNRIEFRIAR